MVFIPGHITGFFNIYYDKDILKVGSTGAGITVDKGVITEVVEGNGNIYFNEKKIDLCPTIEVIRCYKSNLTKCNSSNDYDNSNNRNNNTNDLDNINVYHYSDFPLGCGLGISGGCALGASYNLYKLLKNKVNEEDILKYAHIGEVKCGTGLGDVIGQYATGFVIRTKAGLPPSIKTIDVNIGKYFILIEILGRKETKNIIKNKEWIDKINRTSQKYTYELLKNPTLKNFMELSLNFAIETNLISDKILELCNDLSFTVGASQAMLGNTLFCIVEKKDLDNSISILNRPIVCKIYKK